MKAPGDSSLQGLRAGRSARFAAGFLQWRRAAPRTHLVSVLALLAVALLRWGPMLWDTSRILGDEPAFYQAFERIAAGESPYGGTFFYPPVFAFLGAWGLEHLGATLTFSVLRGINLLGAAVLAWCSLAWAPWSLRRRLLGGSALLLLSPQISHGVMMVNPSVAVASMVLAGLVVVPWRPVRGGLLLGLSIALKPIAPMAVGCLLLAPDREERRSRWTAAFVAAGLALVALASFPYATELLGLPMSKVVEDSASLHRFAAMFGLDIDPLWISALLAAAVAAFLVRSRLGRSRFVLASVVASLLVLPVVWSHTLVLTLPLQVLALQVAADRLEAKRSSAAGAAVPWWLEAVLVVLAVASLQLSLGVSAISEQGLLLQTVAAALPTLAPIGLLGYLLAHSEPF